MEESSREPVRIDVDALGLPDFLRNEDVLSVGALRSQMIDHSICSPGDTSLHCEVKRNVRSEKWWALVRTCSYWRATPQVTREVEVGQ